MDRGPNMIKGAPWELKWAPQKLKRGPIVVDRGLNMIKGDPWELKSGQPKFRKGPDLSG